MPKEDFDRVSSYTRIAYLIGRCLSSLAGQLLLMFDVMTVKELNYMSFASLGVALCLSFILPPVKTSIYFHREEKDKESAGKSKVNRQAEKSTDHLPRLRTGILVDVIEKVHEAVVGECVGRLPKQLCPEVVCMGGGLHLLPFPSSHVHTATLAGDRD